MAASTLWVFITGLGTLVGGDEENPQAADMVLLRPIPPDVTKVPPTPGGVLIPAHAPRLRVVAGGPDIAIQSDELVLPGAPGPAQLQNGETLLPLGRELEFPALRLGRNLIGRPTKIRFKGGEIFPIFVSESFDLARFSFDISLRLNGAVNIEPLFTINKSRDVANGILYKKTLDRGDVPVVLDGVTPRYPREVLSGHTGALPVNGGGKNYVLWISNTSLAAINAEPFDRDFYLLYDWLEDQSVVRYVPAIPQGVIRDPPGQCMFAYVRSSGQ